MTPKPESETDPWAKVKRRQGTVIEHGPGVLGGGAWSAKAAVYLAKEVDAARAAEAAQHQQALERLTRQAQDISVTLGEAGCRAMPIVDGLRWLVDHNLQLRARLAAVEEERDAFKAENGEVPAGAHVETLRQMVGMAGEFRQTLLTVRECIDALTPGHRTGYDWNADPLYMTRYVGDALKAIDAGLKSLNGQAAVPTYRNVYIVTHYPDGGLRGVHASQAGAEAEIAELCREYPDYTRQDFSIVCDRIRPSPPSGASPQAETSDLHAQIMNLPCHRADGQPLSRRSAYREGFRDALIAAAELAAGLPAPVAPQTCEWQINRRSGIGVAGCNSERIDAQSVVVCALAGDTVCFLCGKPLRLVPSDSAPVSPVEPEPPEELPCYCDIPSHILDLGCPRHQAPQCEPEPPKTWSLERAQKLNEIADRVVVLLFVNGFGEHADRLVMKKSKQEHGDLGGWSRDAVKTVILEVLRQEVR